MGSGKLIRRAILKHGVENFTKEILFVFNNEQEMNAKEKELVVVSEETYNLCDGGRGGFSYINRNGLHLTNSAAKKKAGKLGAESKNLRLKTDDNFRLLISQRCRDYLLNNPLKNGFKGKKHNEETLRKMRKPKNLGKENSQYGTCWITNGVENKKIKKEEAIPVGWRKGRILA